MGAGRGSEVGAAPANGVPPGPCGQRLRPLPEGSWPPAGQREPARLNPRGAERAPRRPARAGATCLPPARADSSRAPVNLGTGERRRRESPGARGWSAQRRSRSRPSGRAAGSLAAEQGAGCGASRECSSPPAPGPHLNLRREGAGPGRRLQGKAGPGGAAACGSPGPDAGRRNHLGFKLTNP